MAMEDTNAASDIRAVSQLPDFRSEIRFWQFMVASSFAGSVQNIAMSPVYTVRLHLLLRSFSPKPVPVQQTFGLMIRSMMRQSTLHLRTWMLGSLPAHAVYFSFYEVSKQFLSSFGNPNNTVVHAISGVFAAVSSSLVFTPMEMVNMRMLFQNGKRESIWDCVKRVTREEGVRALYASYRTRIKTYAPYSAVHFATYEAVKRRLLEISPEREVWLVHATAGAAAGGFATAVTTPMHNVKARLSSQCINGYHHYASVSFSRLFISVVKYEGLMAVFRGTLPRMLLHAPGTAICWSTYEAAKSLFQDLNNNSNATTTTS